MNNALRFLYILFIGLIFAFFVGLGIDAFYKAPKSPEYSDAPRPIFIDKNGTTPRELTKEEESEQQRKDEEYRKSYDAYQEKQRGYNKNVSSIATGVAVLAVILGIALMSSALVIADGMALGGIFTLVYALIRAFNGNDPMFRFLVATAGLVIVIVVGYFRFVKNKENEEKKKSRKK